MKDQSSSTPCSKVVSKVKVFKKCVKHQGQDNGTHGKVLSQWILKWNIKAIGLTVQMLKCHTYIHKKSDHAEKHYAQGLTVLNNGNNAIFTLTLTSDFNFHVETKE